METINAAAYEEFRYGWYSRPSTQMYEFWWGLDCKLTLAAEMLDIMPTYIVMEILSSVTVKPELTD